MRIVLGRAGWPFLLKTAAVVLLAGVSGACSTDSSRFSDNPFTNPFERLGSSRANPPADRMPTGSTATVGQRIAPVTSQPLPSLPRTPAALRAAPVTGSAAGWSAQGGTPVTVGQGEGVETLSARYGIPPAAILAANGLSSAGQVQAGQQLIMPVYSAGRAAVPAATAIRPPVSTPAAVATPVRSAALPAATPRPSVAAAAAAPRAVTQAAGAVPARMAAPVSVPQSRPLAVSPAAVTAGRIQPAAPARPAGATPAATPGRIQPAAPRLAARPPTAVEAETPRPAARVAAQPPVSGPVRPQPAPQAASQTPAPAATPRQAMPPKPVEPRRPVAEAPAPKAAEAPQTTASLPAERPAPAADKPEFRWPARGRVISGFGSRSGNGDGIAIAVPEGTPVKAAESGVVAYAGEELKGYGKLVLIRHDNGYVTAYAHNGELNVKRGEAVKRGQVIAKSGQTGNVTSPQLHFEVRKGSQPVDPSQYLDN